MKRGFRFSLSATLIAAACALSCGVSSAGGQTIPFSQRARVSQSVGFTNIDITYGRPVARNRALFGELVPWDSVWHPGADSATRIVFDHDVMVEGKSVKAGAYSIWLVPRRAAAWTFILHRQDRAFHKPYPGAAGEVLRVEITPQQGAHMETLAIYFPVVVRDEAEMRIHWGTTFLPVKVQAPFRPS